MGDQGVCLLHASDEPPPLQSQESTLTSPTQQDVEAAFTAFHFTDTHLEPLYDKDQVHGSMCFSKAYQ